MSGATCRAPQRVNLGDPGWGESCVNWTEEYNILLRFSCSHVEIPRILGFFQSLAVCGSFGYRLETLQITEDVFKILFNR